LPGGSRGLGDVYKRQVVHTPRLDKDHIISIRKAEKHEERIYWKYFPG
jgi:uncharacterized DUF497 family protein